MTGPARPTAPNVCRWCGKHSATDELNTVFHEPTCDQRPAEARP